MVQHRIADGTLPVLRIGRCICARRTTLLGWLENGELVTQADARARRAARREANRKAWVDRQKTSTERHSTKPDNQDT
jgi:hypothetical protein